MTQQKWNIQINQHLAAAKTCNNRVLLFFCCFCIVKVHWKSITRIGYNNKTQNNSTLVMDTVLAPTGQHGLAVPSYLSLANTPDCHEPIRPLCPMLPVVVMSLEK